jgi:hypothetical protein
MIALGIEGGFAATEWLEKHEVGKTCPQPSDLDPKQSFLRRF